MSRADPVRVVAVADTHVPARARDLPAVLWDAIDAADLVVHAGDWVTTDLLDRLEERATRLLACHGNNDPPALASRVPEVARAVVAGVRLGVVHETGGATGRERRCDERHADLDLLVFGHSHIPWDSVTPRGLRLLNPGSPTDRRRQPACTYLTFTLHAGAVRDVELHRLPPRTPAT
ncbi:metallophosphoesterase family protein [Cellulomonas dongxiuzhuiae]|uniref:Phosphoesterase n=1 Tax=Cellulomonas dongxiuzhuiae TaxID=2819979 RepID=A0ABX8GFG9_9CELL|nr:YfcE family phosphodiesterase [Cellulomonas dongxiuzhuiae]MBO3093771.1 YfcE family phosphodiesterase [Cellulomonas dongxiuzhuiae]QWC14877.1 YfcE family phosphodiesterase [Cellulomonas dongxiuzhuiae]